MLCHIMLTPTESMRPSVKLQTLTLRAFFTVLYRMSNCEDFFKLTEKSTKLKQYRSQSYLNIPLSNKLEHVHNVHIILSPMQV
jgi:hypothetical protein